MFTIDELKSIRSGLLLARDKNRYLESFVIYHDPSRFSLDKEPTLRSMDNWIEEQKNLAIKELQIKKTDLAKEILKIEEKLREIESTMQCYK